LFIPLLLVITNNWLLINIPLEFYCSWNQVSHLFQMIHDQFFV
jgi:hypothetical protein